MLDMAAAARLVGYSELAVWLLESVLTADANQGRARRWLAELAEEQHDLHRALALWEEIAQADPADHEARGKVRDLSASVASGKYYAERKSRRSKRSR